jgi:hypothetical protein
LQAGVVECLACVLAYFLAFMERGVPAASVVGFGDKKDMPITIGRWRDEVADSDQICQKRPGRAIEPDV